MSGGAASEPESPRGVRWSTEAPEKSSSYPPPSPNSNGQHAGSQGSMPSNYAYDEHEGYTEMLLYKLSPRLAEAIFPIIATRAVEAFVAAMLITGMALSVPPLTSPSLSGKIMYLSFTLYIPGLHRLSLLHTRRFMLLLRQFEVWYLGMSTVIFLISTFTAGKSYYVRLYAVNMCASGWSVIALDSICMPRSMVLYTMLLHLVVISLWVFYFFFELGSWYMDYDMLWVGSIRRTSVAMGRMCIAVLFFIKYTVTILLRPDAYVILRRPLFVRDARSIIEQALGSHATASLLRRLSSHSNARYKAAKVVPLPIKPSATSVSTNNPLCTPSQLPEALTPPTSPSTTPHDPPLQAASETPSPALPDLEPSTSPSTSPSHKPRRLPPLQLPVSSSADPSPASDKHKAPNDASVPLPARPEPLPLDEPLSLPPPQPVDEDPTLLHHYLGLPAFLIQFLSHSLVQRVEFHLWFATSILCTAPFFLAASDPPWLVHLSWLWLLITFRRMLFIYPELLVIQLCSFETMLLLGNVGFALLTLRWGIFTSGPANAWAANLVLSTLPAILIDSLHLHASVKQMIAATQSLFLFGFCAAISVQPCSHLDQEVMLISRITAGSFFMGRLFTFGIFVFKYAVNLWLRPDTFLVLCAPLMRHQRLGLLVRTLRELA